MLKLWCYLPFITLLCIPAIHAVSLDKKHINSKIIQPFTAQYKIIRQNDTVGSAVRKLIYIDHNKAQYSYQTDIKWLIFSDNRQERSIVTLNENQVSPLQYYYNREGTGTDKNYQWRYDLANSSATDINKNRTVTINFPDNIQDKLSYHFQHRLNIKNNPKQKHFVYPVIDTSGKIKNYVYQFDGEEELMLPYGTITTIRMKREVIEKEKITYAWFAPKLDYLMVKLLQSKKGIEQFQAQLNTLTID